MLLLDAGIACHQGWTLAQAREQPFEDILTLAAYKHLEAKWMRRDTDPGAGPSSRGPGGGKQQSTVADFRLRPKK